MALQRPRWRSTLRVGVETRSATNVSLLRRVCDTSDAAAWREFAERYREFLLRFCRTQGLQQADAEDVVQIVLTNLARSLPRFKYAPERGRFRDYLYRCTRNAIPLLASKRDARLGLDHMDLSGAKPELAEVWEQEWISHHYRLAMQRVRETFDARSVEIFDLSLSGESVPQLTSRFGMSAQSVHKVRQRIRARLEELIARQIEEEEHLNAR
jgi:RNA polymerase sigma-70 factor, ECF subfamily